MFKSAIGIVCLVFTILGLVFLGIGVGFGVEEALFNRTALTTPGVISDVLYYDSSDSTGMHVFVSYEVDGEPYEVRSNFTSSSMRVGQQVTVKYDPENPQRMRIDHFPIFAVVFGGLGAAFLIVVIVLLVVMRRKKAQSEHLQTYGTQVSAKIAEVQRNRNMYVNGRNPYIVVVQWISPDDGKTYLFRSENLWFNPESLIEQRGITELPVFLDPYDPRKYHVSVEALKENVVAL